MSLSLDSERLMMLNVCVCVCVCAQSCPTLWDPMDCSLPGFSLHGIFQARILEWVAISISLQTGFSTGYQNENHTGYNRVNIRIY